MSKYIVNPELEARLIAQRRVSTIASLFVGLLLMALLALLFWLIGIVSMLLMNERTYWGLFA